MSSAEATISVSGEASVPISADVAWLRLVIKVEAKTAAEAAEQSAARINIVLDSIRETAGYRAVLADMRRMRGGMRAIDLQEELIRELHVRPPVAPHAPEPDEPPGEGDGEGGEGEK